MIFYKALCVIAQHFSPFSHKQAFVLDMLDFKEEYRSPVSKDDVLMQWI